MEPVPAAIVLCGGASRRMGTDKALLDVDGSPLLERVVRSLITAGARTVALVGPERHSVHLPPVVVWAADSHPHSGPLGGLIDGLRLVDHGGVDPSTPVMVSACDHPALDPSEMGVLLRTLGEDPTADAVIPDVLGRSQPLHAVYRLRVAGELRAAFGRGERSLLRSVVTLRVLRPERASDSYLDVDDPEALRSYLARRGDPPDATNPA